MILLHKERQHFLSCQLSFFGFLSHIFIRTFKSCQQSLPASFVPFSFLVINFVENWDYRKGRWGRLTQFYVKWIKPCIMECLAKTIKTVSGHCNSDLSVGHKGKFRQWNNRSFTKNKNREQLKLVTHKTWESLTEIKNKTNENEQISLVSQSTKPESCELNEAHRPRLLDRKILLFLASQWLDFSQSLFCPQIYR